MVWELSIRRGVLTYSDQETMSVAVRRMVDVKEIRVRSVKRDDWFGVRRPY